MGWTRSAFSLSAWTFSDRSCGRPGMHSCRRAPCVLRGYKNTAVSLPEIVKVVPNQDVDCSVSGSSFSVFLLCLGCMWYFVFFCFWLSVPVQSIAWKDSSSKLPIICRVRRKPFQAQWYQVITLQSGQSGAQDWALECPNVKKLKRWLRPVWR